jgi:isoamylase
VGAPLILGGDELGRTQRGNNNAYCQDNPVSWVDWSAASAEHDLAEFVATLCRFRRSHPRTHRRRFFVDGEIDWLRPDGERMTAADWGAPIARALTVASADRGFVLMVNGWWGPLSFRLPEGLRGNAMTVAVDTSQAIGPATIGPMDAIELVGRSLVLLEPPSV